MKNNFQSNTATVHSDSGQPLLITQRNGQKFPEAAAVLPEILLITAIPPRDGVIATYAHSLITAIDQNYKKSFNVSVCAIENARGSHNYSKDLKYVLDTVHSRAFIRLAKVINLQTQIRLVVIQHEFEYFSGSENDLIRFLTDLAIPVITVFHSVTPQPDSYLKLHVRQIAATSSSVLVMTESALTILLNDYEVPADKIHLLDSCTYPAIQSPGQEPLQHTMWEFCNKYLN